MIYCRMCGIENVEEASYCVQCGHGINVQRAVTVMNYETVVSHWTLRFIAWIIDVVILSLIFTPLREILRPWGLAVPDVISWIPFVSLGLENVFYFGYWAFMEGTYGQSIGKMVLGIKVINRIGTHVTLGQAAIQSLGKAFLLPLDCLLGWFLYPNEKQRFFNHVSETIVVPAKK